MEFWPPPGPSPSGLPPPGRRSTWTASHPDRPPPGPPPPVPSLEGGQGEERPSERESGLSVRLLGGCERANAPPARRLTRLGRQASERASERPGAAKQQQNTARKLHSNHPCGGLCSFSRAVQTCCEETDRIALEIVRASFRIFENVQTFGAVRIRVTVVELGREKGE